MKFYKTLITLLMLFVFTSAFAQRNIHPQKLVEEAKQTETFQTLNLFTPKAHDKNKVIEVGKTISEFSLLKLEKQSLQDLFQTAPDYIQLQLPRQEKSTLEIELVKVDIFADGFQVIQSSTNGPANVDLGLHYRGIIKGSNQSFAAISIFENSLMGLVSSSAGNYVLGKLKGQASDENTYILYNDKEVLSEIGLSCETPDDGYVYTRDELAPATVEKDLTDCTRIYLEVDHDIFLNKGGISNTTDYITGLFNQVATIYSAESMNTEISELFIWDTPSPYSGGSSSSMLSQFQNLRTDFNGDLGELFSYQSSGGIAAGFSGICNSNRAQSLCFSSINSTYADVPTYSWTIMVTTHELGHLFGSRHTHACVWNGNGTAIDGCSGSTEGSCPIPGDPPGGGTIMSYCHLSNVGINFSLGFGPQPGDVIRNIIENADCLVACNGGGGGGGPCSQNVLTFSITLDERGYETTWEILDEDGNVMFAGGPYEEAEGTVITESVCLNNGCYTFAIYDSGNNGICCRHGFGHFALTEDINGNVLASGGRFFGSQVVPFCVEAGDGGGDNGGGGGADCTDNDLALFITLDNFGSQTTWTLNDDNGNLLYEGGPYANNMNGTVIEESLCVVDDCFNFSIFDSAGNGICCNSGNGSYFLVDPNSNVILQGGSFGAVESTDFCYPDMGGGGGDCTAINFSDYSIDAYADDDGSGNVLDNGIGIRVANDAWKSIPFNYTVTPDTKIKFEFRSLKQGDIHGIGFDDDNLASPDRTFQVYGTEDWGIDLNTYSPTNWVSYIIPVGQYYTGSFDRMFFIAAKEGRGNSCNSYFRNLYIYEGNECDDAGSLSELGASIKAQDLIVYPNPITSKLKVSLSAESDQRVSIQIFNLVGQKVLQSEDFLIKGRNTLSLDAKVLDAGTYILKIGSGEDLKTTKFVKQ